MPTDPRTDPLRFAYWVPNVSGGLVTSTIEQRTDWSFEYNRRLARLAERAGFEYALSQVRYTASYGAEFQHESTSFSLALLLATERLKLIAAIHPGLWHPGRAGQVGGHRRPPVRGAGRGQRRLGLVQGRVPPARGAMARA
ncbi:MAG TPA: LLM class flavin-dependent oxidoreductase [Solirubrobacteraceae bacterium]